MQPYHSTSKKLRAVTQSLAVSSNRDRKLSDQFPPKVIKKQTAGDPTFPPMDQSTLKATEIKHHRPQNSSNLSNRQESLPNNKFIIAQTKVDQTSKPPRKLSDVPKGLPQHKYNLPESLHQPKKAIVDSFKQQLISRDKYDHPIKYKIVKEQLGFNPETIYKLKNSELSRIHQQYQKDKGMQYLREAQRNVRIKTQIPQTASHLTSKTKPKVEIRKRTKSEKVLKGKRAVLQQLRQKEDVMGKIVYQRVKRHLKEEKVSNDFKHRVHSEQAIDRALVDFLKLKIERAETTLKQI